MPGTGGERLGDVCRIPHGLRPFPGDASRQHFVLRISTHCKITRLAVILPALPAGAAAPSGKEDRLVAIDVLFEPDQPMLAAAEQWNKRLREQMQQYVAEKDLDAVAAALKSLQRR